MDKDIKEGLDIIKEIKLLDKELDKMKDKISKSKFLKKKRECDKMISEIVEVIKSQINK